MPESIYSQSSNWEINKIICIICEGFLFLLPVFKIILGIYFVNWIYLNFIVTRLWYPRPMLLLSLLRVLLDSAAVPYSLSLSEFYLSVSFHPYMWDSIIDNGDRQKGFPESGLGGTNDKRKDDNDEGDWVTSRTEAEIELTSLFLYVFSSNRQKTDVALPGLIAPGGASLRLLLLPWDAAFF